jgi:hypothetical protein
MTSYKERRMNELIRQATKLIDLDREIVKAVVESDFEKIPTLLSEFRETKILVLKKFSELSIVENVDDGTRQILDRVQREFPTDNIIRNLENKTEADSSFFELSWEEADEIGSDLLYSWISHYEFVRDLFKVNALIFQATIPPELRQYINEVRNCFAFQQYNATISLCRTILEAAAKDICEEKDFFKPYGDKVIEINPNKFNQLIKAISSGELKKRAVKLYYCDACPVVHGDRAVTSDEALRILQNTTEVVQKLYALNKV